jgi:predicted short-subunit dehydrogenase-like oxidoreductase (DUF2520 family)
MNTLQPTGLMASGRMSDSTLLRVPQLGLAIGPIVAGSKRLASRYANTLRCGAPAAGAAAFAPCRLLWLQAAPADLGPFLSSLEQAPFSWRGKTVVLLDPTLDSAVLAPLAARGAAVASLTHAPSRQETILLAEGAPAALRALRSLARQAGVRLLELKPGLKPIYAAGLLAAESLTASVVDAALACLRSAGFDAATAKRLGGAIVENATREQLAHGRKSWSNPLSPGRRGQTLHQLEALDRFCPEHARFLRAVLTAAVDLQGLSETTPPPLPLPLPRDRAPAPDRVPRRFPPTPAGPPAD